MQRFCVPPRLPRAVLRRLPSSLRTTTQRASAPTSLFPRHASTLTPPPPSPPTSAGSHTFVASQSSIVDVRSEALRTACLAEGDVSQPYRELMVMAPPLQRYHAVSFMLLLDRLLQTALASDSTPCNGVRVTAGAVVRSQSDPGSTLTIQTMIADLYIKSLSGGVPLDVQTLNNLIKYFGTEPVHGPELAQVVYEDVYVRGLSPTKDTFESVVSVLLAHDLAEDTLPYLEMLVKRGSMSRRLTRRIIKSINAKHNTAEPHSIKVTRLLEFLEQQVAQQLDAVVVRLANSSSLSDDDDDEEDDDDDGGAHDSDEDSHHLLSGMYESDDDDDDGDTTDAENLLLASGNGGQIRFFDAEDGQELSPELLGQLALRLTGPPSFRSMGDERDDDSDEVSDGDDNNDDKVVPDAVASNAMSELKTLQDDLDAFEAGLVSLRPDVIPDVGFTVPEGSTRPNPFRVPLNQSLEPPEFRAQWDNYSGTTYVRDLSVFGFVEFPPSAE